MRRRTKRLLLATAVLVAADQVLLYTALSDGVLAGRRIAPFDPPIFSPRQRNRLESLRRIAAESEDASSSLFDRELGWCPEPNEERGLYRYDHAGARIGTEPFPLERPAGRIVVAVGCSFTRCDEVEGEDAWPALVDAAHDDLSILNLGMGGYGLDQAYLRMKRDGFPHDPDEVWVGFVPGTALRVVTHFPPVLKHWSGSVAFKPRFVPTDGGLELVPNPVRAFADFERLLGDQRAFLDAVGESDLWVRRAPSAYAREGSSPLHWTALGRLGLTWLEHGDRDAEPWVADGSSEVHRVLAGVFELLARDAEAAGVRLRVLVLPSQPDLAASAAGRRYWEALTDRVTVSGVDVLDATDALVAAGALEDGAFWMEGGHYSPTANRAVAELVSSEWVE